MAGVEVTNLTFSYSRRGSNLENINMLVPKGTIYGLLGPSGCCKTTLLRCIVGRLKPREGTVKVFGFKPGTKECGIPGPNIGYMPQDLSLISQFTVRETLEYYAGFAQTPDANGHYNKGCNEKNLNQRIEFLLTLLDISQFEHVFTDRLSGGQKRRVSLAVAMINDPPLLILDEPTVGVDPIVRDAIWSYLLEQSKNGLTIIVTTHYIEEAASAHNVGFMRQGRILAEGNPAVLMAQFRAPTLEHLFLMLSKKDDKTRTHESDGLCQVAMDGSVVSSSALDSFSQPPSAVVVAETVFSNGGSLIPNGGSYSAEHHSHHHSTLHNHHLVNHHHPHHHNNHQLPTLPPPDYSITTDCSRVSDVALDSFTGTTTATTADSSQTETNNNNNSTYANGANGNCCKSVITKSQHQCQEASTGALVTITKLETKTTNNSSTTATLTVPDSPILGPRRSKFNSVSGGSTRKHRGYSVHKQSDKVNSFQKVGVLCRKHRLRLFRRVPELVITMLLPALEVALFCLCMGRDPTAIQMAVCNQENPPFMSMVFLKSIDPDFIQLKYYDTPEQAIDSVRNADTYSAIVLAKNFTSSMQNFATKVYPNKMGLGGPGGGGGGTVDTATTLAKMLHSRMTMPVTTSTASLPLLSTSLGPENSGLLDTPPGSEMPTSTPLPMTAATAAAAVLSSTSTTTIAPGVSAIPIDLIDPSKLGSSPYEQDDSIIKIYYDGSNALHVNIIRRELFSAVFRFVDYLGKLVGATGIANQLPIKFEKPIYGNEKTDMIEFVGPGLMVFIVFFATMSITSMAFLSERREGTLERSLIVGMTPTEFIISQIINITFLLIVQIILTVVMGFWIFSFPMKGSYVLAVTMMFCQGLCGMTYGLMLSAICTNEMTALMLGAGSQLMFCFITGIFWPVDTMIPLLRYFSYMMPQTLPMESFRHILIRGFDLSRPAVLNGYFISIGWIIFFLVLAIVIFRFR